MRGKLVGAALQLFEQPLDGIPISVGEMPKSEAELKECRLQPRWSIDEKQILCDVVFLVQFLQKLLCQNVRSRWKQTHVEEFVRVRIDSSVQPKPLINEFNHSLVDRNVIQTVATDWL